jgi:hypothetical protein
MIIIPGYVRGPGLHADRHARLPGPWIRPAVRQGENE